MESCPCESTFSRSGVEMRYAMGPARRVRVDPGAARGKSSPPRVDSVSKEMNERGK